MQITEMNSGSRKLSNYFEVLVVEEGSRIHYFDPEVPVNTKVCRDIQYLNNSRWVTRKPETYTKWRAKIPVSVKEILKNGSEKAILVLSDISLNYSWAICNEAYDDFNFKCGFQKAIRRLVTKDIHPLSNASGLDLVTVITSEIGKFVIEKNCGK